MNFANKADRERTYMNAFLRYGESAQMIVAIEEFSEVQKEICKHLRGKGNLDHLAEEVADVQVMLEQIQMFFPIKEDVQRIMAEKVQRLDDRLRDDEKQHSGLLEV